MTDKPRVQAMSSGVMLGDGLINILANIGTGRDKAAQNQYFAQGISAHELLNTYRASWLAGAIVDYPAEDATRNWRNWRAQKDQISKIEELEKRLGIKKKTQRAMKTARLYGGAAIYINTSESGQSLPLKPGQEVKSLAVISRLKLKAKEIVTDISNEYYGQAEYYTLTTKAGNQVEIHASRLVIFTGRDLLADCEDAGAVNAGWGDSILESAIQTVSQCDGTMANMASLVFEAKIDIFKFKGFADLLADQRNDPMISRRLINQAAMKGINGAVVIDSEDEYDQKSATFAGLPDVVSKFQEAVAGAAGMPVTRLFGRAVAGLSGSGDGDERVYYDRIKDYQETEVSGSLSVLDECIIWQALGSRPSDIYYSWAPLRQSTSAERADVFSKTATALRALAGTQAGEIIPIDALSDAAVNEFTEMGVLPGLDQGIAKYGTLAEQGLPLDNEGIQ